MPLLLKIISSLAEFGQRSHAARTTPQLSLIYQQIAQLAANTAQTEADLSASPLNHAMEQLPQQAELQRSAATEEANEEVVVEEGLVTIDKPEEEELDDEEFYISQPDEENTEDEEQDDEEFYIPLTDDEETEEEDTVRHNHSLNPTQRHKMYKVACFFSRYGHSDLYPNDNQYEALQHAAKALQIKPNTLKNTRDLFDGQMPESRRRGWIDPPMSNAKRKAVNALIAEIRTKSRYDLRDEIRDILQLW